MRTLRSRKPGPAVVIASVALIVALGGTSYAALNIPINSVGSAQLKNAAVTTKKLANGAVTALKINARKLTVFNALHANSAATANSATVTNGVGTLASGQTERGLWFLSDWAASAPDGSAATAITFPIPLAQPPTAVHYIPPLSPGETPPPGCFGNAANPGAEPGNLCVFEGRDYNAAGTRGIEDPTDSALNQADRFGTGIYMIGAGTAAGGEADTGGSWAVTAP
jgi:hypothetical protein